MIQLSIIHLSTFYRLEKKNKVKMSHVPVFFKRKKTRIECGVHALFRYLFLQKQKIKQTRWW
jgi:hypothetical protein